MQDTYQNREERAVKQSRHVETAVQTTRCFEEQNCVFGPDEYVSKSVLFSMFWSLSAFQQFDGDELYDMAWSVIRQGGHTAGFAPTQQSCLSVMFEHVLVPALLERGCGVCNMSQFVPDVVFLGVSVVPRIDGVAESRNNTNNVIQGLVRRMERQKKYIDVLSRRVEEMYHVLGMPGHFAAAQRVEPDSEPDSESESDTESDTVDDSSSSSKSPSLNKIPDLYI
jgi:hypothetical protein